jgi:hypothetical protein
VTDARSFLLDALRRANDGSEVPFEELLDVMPDPSVLNRIERDAWHRLSQWADDGDIRVKDPGYDEMQRKQIAKALGDVEALEAGYLPEEVGRGEHRARHLPLWGCLLATAAVIAVLIYLI